jgi:hypothetical protein
MGESTDKLSAMAYQMYADLPDGRGYLRIHVSSWRGVTIDVAFNTGADDELGLQVAARLTNNAYTAYSKQAGNGPADPGKHGRLRTVTVNPATGPRYTGPVNVLISDLTVSAGETFTESLLGRTPAPVRIGTNTPGVFADDIQRTLPNGWTFRLGNEDYFGPDGRNHEGEGIPRPPRRRCSFPTSWTNTGTPHSTPLTVPRDPASRPSSRRRRIVVMTPYPRVARIDGIRDDVRAGFRASGVH